MTWVYLAPKGGLLFRDGRTFESSNRADTMPWPMPQVLLAALRTFLGRCENFDWEFTTADAELKALLGDATTPGAAKVRSVWFARREADGRVELFPPRPQDLVRFPGCYRSDGRPLEGASMDYPLRPRETTGWVTSVALALDAPLAPLGHEEPSLESKPLGAEHTPGFMGTDTLCAWLRSAGTEAAPQDDTPAPLMEDRVRLERQRLNRTAREGMLFSLRRLVMPDVPSGPKREYGIAMELEGVEGKQLDGLWRLGGKGGAAMAEVLAEVPESWKALRAASVDGEFRDGRFRWVLTSPARFKRGWLPDFIEPDGTGEFPETSVRVRLRAAAIDRPLAYSGWDLQAGRAGDRAGGGPRATRLFARPGSVYFFEVLGLAGEAAEEAARAIARRWSLVPVRETRRDDGVPRTITDPDEALDLASGLGAGVFGAWDWFPAENSANTETAS